MRRRMSCSNMASIFSSLQAEMGVVNNVSCFVSEVLGYVNFLFCVSARSFSATTIRC